MVSIILAVPTLLFALLSLPRWQAWNGLAVFEVRAVLAPFLYALRRELVVSRQLFI